MGLIVGLYLPTCQAVRHSDRNEGGNAFAALHCQPNRDDAVLQAPQTLAQQKSEQAGAYQKGKEAQRQPGAEAIRAEEGLRLLSLVLLDGYDLRHALVG